MQTAKYHNILENICNIYITSKETDSIMPKNCEIAREESSNNKYCKITHAERGKLPKHETCMINCNA